jgi:hypothetical protein
MQADVNTKKPQLECDTARTHVQFEQEKSRMIQTLSRHWSESKDRNRDTIFHFALPIPQNVHGFSQSYE